MIEYNVNVKERVEWVGKVLEASERVFELALHVFRCQLITSPWIHWKGNLINHRRTHGKDIYTRKKEREQIGFICGPLVAVAMVAGRAGLAKTSPRMDSVRPSS